MEYKCNSYIGVRSTSASPIKLEEFIKEAGYNPYANNETIPEKFKEGYILFHGDQPGVAKSYLPKHIFERSHRPSNLINGSFLYSISSDYKERFKGEFYYIKHKYEELINILNNWDNFVKQEPYFFDNMPSDITCSKELLEKQAECMETYIDILEERAKVENIELKGMVCFVE